MAWVGGCLWVLAQVLEFFLGGGARLCLFFLFLGLLGALPEAVDWFLKYVIG